MKLSASDGQYSRGWGVTFTEPYFLDQRLAAGFDIYHKDAEPQHIRALLHLDDRREPAPRRADHRRIHVPADTIRSTTSQINIPNIEIAAVQRLSTRRSTAFAGAGGPGRRRAASLTPTTDDGQLLDQRRGLAGDQAGGGAGRDPDVAGRLFADLGQHRRPQESRRSGLYATFHQDVAGLGGNRSSCARPSMATITTR